jgi:hypothetical protein
MQDDDSSKPAVGVGASVECTAPSPDDITNAVTRPVCLFAALRPSLTFYSLFVGRELARLAVSNKKLVALLYFPPGLTNSTYFIEIQRIQPEFKK